MYMYIFELHLEVIRYIYIYGYICKYLRKCEANKKESQNFQYY